MNAQVILFAAILVFIELVISYGFDNLFNPTLDVYFMVLSMN